MIACGQKKLPVIKNATLHPFPTVKSLQTNLPLRPGRKGLMDFAGDLPFPAKAAEKSGGVMAITKDKPQILAPKLVIIQRPIQDQQPSVIRQQH